MLPCLIFLELFQQLSISGSPDRFLPSLLQFGGQSPKSYTSCSQIVLKRLSILAPKPHVSRTLGGLALLDHMGIKTPSNSTYQLFLFRMLSLSTVQGQTRLLLKLGAIIQHFFKFETKRLHK